MTASPCPLSPASLDAVCASILAAARATLEDDPARPVDQALDEASTLLLGKDADPVFADLAGRLCRRYLSGAAHRPWPKAHHADFVPHLLSQVLPRAWRDATQQPVPAAAAYRAALAVLTEVAGQLRNVNDFAGDPPAGDEAPYGPLTFGQVLDKALLQVAQHQFPGPAALHGELLARLALGDRGKPYKPGAHPYLTLDEARAVVDSAYELLHLNHQYLAA